MKEKLIHITKHLMFIAIIVVISIPAVQHFYKFGPERELHGAIVIKEYKPFTWETWFNSEYQESTAEYINHNFGFRSEFIRLNNQRHYSFFNRAKANQVIVGKESYLYEENYIKAHLGIDFLGNKEIAEKTRKLKFIQEKLKETGTDLYVVFAPGKGSYCPEFIPDSYKKDAQSNTNYKSYLKEFNRSGS